MTNPSLNLRRFFHLPTPAPIDDPFARAAFRTVQSVRPEMGRQEETLTRFLESYIPHVAHGIGGLGHASGSHPVRCPRAASHGFR